MWFLVLTVQTLVLSVLAQISPGIYRIGSVDFPQTLITQSGNTIAGFGGNGAISQTWFITPTVPSGQVTIQNAGSLQYISVSGTPANGSTVVPSSTPFAWTLQQSGIAVDGFFITISPGSIAPLTLTAGPPELRTQQWTLSTTTPLPATYRLLNTDTNAYLTGSSTLPGSLSLTSVNATSAVQVWHLAGTGPGSTSGTFANFKTGGFIAISSSRALGTFTTSQTFDFRWLFAAVGGGDRLSSATAASPNVISISPLGLVILDVAGSSDSKQTWTFVPASTTGLV